jgi:hypothetical protein
VTHFPTCTGCSVERKTCAELARLRTALKGFSATTVKHRCEDRVARFVPGTPVIVHTYSQNGQMSENGIELADYRGVFIREIGSRGLAYIAPGTIDETHRSNPDNGYPFEPKTNGVGFVKLTLTRMRPIEDEPPVDASECPVCKSLYGITGRCEGADIGTGPCPNRKTFLDGMIALEGKSWVTQEEKCRRGDHEFRYDGARRETLCIHCGADDIPF